jgi:hypothetical protein
LKAIFASLFVGKAMKQFLPVNWMKLMALLCLFGAAMLAHAADVAGSVSFAIGDAVIVGSDGKSTPATRGASVVAGQTLVTGATGHIHVRMIDNAFISVRPQSKLRIEEYRYDVATPANNRIKFVLEQGVARSITGRAGEAAKENYRLNTPLAAIGIRGTDFVVQAGVDITRVTVQSGAVVMTPLGNDCAAAAFGPCKSAASRVLTAAMRDAYLELRNRNEAPLLVPAEKALESPNRIAPPRPEEPRPSTDKQAKAGTSADAQDAIRDATAGVIKTQVDAVVVTPPATTPQTGTVTPPPVPQYWWGRWSGFVQPGQESSSIVAVLAPDREITVGNSVFGLVREKGDVVMPNAGTAKFQLADSEAAVLRDGKTLTSAQITSPTLTVDFGARHFETALTVNSAGMSPVSVQASGNITFQGNFFSDANASNAVVNGSLSKDSSQAAYVFQRDLASNLSVLGVTRWVR